MPCLRSQERKQGVQSSNTRTERLRRCRLDHSSCQLHGGAHWRRLYSATTVEQNALLGVGPRADRLWLLSDCLYMPNQCVSLSPIWVASIMLVFPASRAPGSIECVHGLQVPIASCKDSSDRGWLLFLALLLWPSVLQRDAVVGHA